MLSGIRNIFEDKRFDTYKHEIDRRNYVNMRMFIIFSLVIGILNSVGELIMLKSVYFLPAIITILLFFIIILTLYRIKMSPESNHLTLIFYLIQIPMMVFAIMVGTFFDTKMPAVSIMVFMCVLPLFMLDKPWRICIYITVCAVCFLVCGLIAKNGTVLGSDIINLLAFWLIAIVVNLFSTGERIESVERSAEYMDESEHDILTGLYNRSGEEKINNLLVKGIPGAFVILDIDDFKITNDKYGHDTGDAVIKLVSDSIRSTFRSSDIIMRLGGDEFIIYAALLDEKLLCTRKLEEMAEKTRENSISITKNHEVTVSMGCIINDGSYREYSALYREADKYMYMAKEKGKDRFIIK